jgi:hypothetical protein
MTAQLSDAERTQIEHACARLVIEANLCLDEYRHERLLELYAPDAVVDSPLGLMRGHAELKRYYDSRERGATIRHVISNLLIEVKDAKDATGIAYYSFYYAPAGAALPAPLGAPKALGVHRDCFVRLAGGWRFANRKISNVFRAAD